MLQQRLKFTSLLLNKIITQHQLSRKILLFVSIVEALINIISVFRLQNSKTKREGVVMTPKQTMNEEGAQQKSCDSKLLKHICFNGKNRACLLITFHLESSTISYRLYLQTIALRKQSKPFQYCLKSMDIQKVLQTNTKLKRTRHRKHKYKEKRVDMYRILIMKCKQRGH